MSTFRSISGFAISFVMFLTLTVNSSECASSFHAGQRAFTFQAPNRLMTELGIQSTTIHGIIWYPTSVSVPETPQSLGAPGHPLFDAGLAAVNAPIATYPRTDPLILLSHGTGGAASQLAWLGTALARNGFIAIAIDHPGNSIGQKTIQGFVMWWYRPKELSLLLDHVLANPTFGSHIDRRRIGAAGFSIGGFSVLALAGAIVDMAQYRAACAENALQCDVPRELPNLKQRAKTLMADDPNARTALTTGVFTERDPRIRAVFAIAPAVGPAVTRKSLRAIDVPVRIAYGTNDETVLPQFNSQMYAATIPTATILVVPNAGHYTFLDTCTALGKSLLPLLCIDSAGVARSAVHASVGADASSFFTRTL